MSDKKDLNEQSPDIHIMGLTVKGEGEDYNYEFCSIHEQMLHSLETFIYDLRQNDLFLPWDTFRLILDDMECFVFEPDKHDKDQIKFKTITKDKDKDKKLPSVIAAVRNLNHDLAEIGLELKPKTTKKLKRYLEVNLSKAFDASAIDEVPEDTLKLRERKRHDKIKAKEKQGKAALEIGKHLKGKEAHRLLKRASMHYFDNIGSSLKAALYEGASNSPTFYMAAIEPGNANIMKSAFAGGALTASFVGESGLNLLRLLKCLRLEGEFRNNSQLSGEEDALKILENNMHKEGLLFEGLSEQNLRDYPGKIFDNIIETRRLFREQGHFKKRALEVSDYLRDNKVEAAKKIALSPLRLANGVRKLLIGSAYVVGKLGVDSIINPLKFAYHANILRGAQRIVQAPFTYKVTKNELRHRDRQRPHFIEITRGKHRDSVISKSDPDFNEELRRTRQSVNGTISASNFEIGRFGLESVFIGGHVAELAHCASEVAESGEVFSGNMLKCLVSYASISLALEPWAHLGHNLDETHRKITGQRSKQASQHDRYLQLMDTIEADKKRKMEHADDIEEEHPDRSMESEPDGPDDELRP